MEQNVGSLEELVFRGPQQYQSRSHGQCKNSIIQFYFHFVIKRLRSNENIQKVKYVYPPKITKDTQIS